MQALQSARAVSRPARASVVVRCSAEQPSVSRRSVFGLLAAAAASAIVLPQEASAVKLPFQDSVGGLGKGVTGGSMPKNPSTASMEGYTMEGYPGTKKPSYLSPSKRSKLLAKARKEAEKASK